MSPHPILLPYPQNLEITEGSFELPERGIILLDGEHPQAILPVGALIEKTLWTQLRINWELNAARTVPPVLVRIHIQQTPTENAHSQLYHLKISSNLITIYSKSPNGLYYGACTLVQLIKQYGRVLPCMEITDWPDIEIRGVMLDISRDKVYKNETLYELVDRLASLKLNQLQLYTEHTYAYHNHPVVWEHASPMTGEDILALDRYCKDRFIELVPNQNSFGHMERWLKHPEYADLAEIHGEFKVPWGTATGPFSLAPVDERSYQLMTNLYDELLPHFSSRQINIGCDETFDIGTGKSKQACDEKGVGVVYLEYLLQLYADLSSRGFTVQFWGDIILEHAELVDKLPKDMIALEWGYEADHPFATHGKLFAESGLAFYVCPGTSAWNSIAGRTENALKNLLSAAENGKKYHAIGYLITDWGDNGHWQAVPFNLFGIGAGAAYSWAKNPNESIDIAKAIGRILFDDPSGTIGSVLYDLGNVYRTDKVVLHNASFLFEILQRPLSAGLAEKIGKHEFAQKLDEIERIKEKLLYERMARPDSEIVRSEINLTIRLLQHACKRGLAALSEGDGDWAALYHDLEDMITEYRRLWLLRNRPGGLEDSVKRLEKLKSEYMIS